MRTSGSPRSQTGSAYVYAILIDGMVRYIGKGRNGRMYSHLIDAKRSAIRCGRSTKHLTPRLHRRLVEAVRSSADIKEKIIVAGLTDRQAYRLENRLIAEFHKLWTDQLWNAIDERFMDPRWLPEKWHDPETVLYRLPRPLARHAILIRASRNTHPCGRSGRPSPNRPRSLARRLVRGGGAPQSKI